MKTITIAAIVHVLSTYGIAQNVGIGVTNPTKGKLEIAGALGNQTTVLTIGSDGAGISLQRNWPTIGFNQYRDANNVQRFIGTGHAGSIFLSATDGSMVFTQFGQGTAGGLITNTSYPLVISPDGSLIVSKGLTLGSNGTIKGGVGGAYLEMLPFAFGSVRSDGVKMGGTNNFTTKLMLADNNAYRIEFAESIVYTLIVVTPRSNGARFATASLYNDETYNVRIYDKDGISQTNNITFDFIVYKR